MIDSCFQYIIPLFNDKKEDASPLQGFTPGILDSPKFIYKILSLPSNIFEFTLDRDQCIALRTKGIGNYRIIPIGIDFLHALRINFGQPFICIFSDEKTIVTVNDFLKNINYPILHVSTINDSSSIYLGEIHKDHLRSYVEKVRDFLKPHLKPEVIQLINNCLSIESNWPTKHLDINRRNHNITIPNEIALSFFNFQFMNHEVLANNNNDPYIKAIIASAGPIIDARSRALPSAKDVPFPPPIDLVITAPSMFRHLYTRNINWKKLEATSDDKKLANIVYKLHIHQVGYSFKTTGPELSSILQSKLGTFFIQMRQEELQAYTAAISVKTCSYFIPSLRLPPSVNMLHDDLIRLGNCSRGKHAHKKFGKMKHMNQLAKRIIDRLSNSIPLDFVPIIDRDYNQIKLITDSPLEWLPVRDLPLMLRYDTSRIPTTPGNLFFQQTIDTEKIVLPYSAFKEVLIIRSFDDADPCKKATEISLRTILEPPNEESYEILIKDFDLDHKLGHKSFIKSHINTKIKVVDVHTKQEFINALNSYKGAILIYDGHGAHGKETDIGTLKIGKEDLDIIELRRKVKIPPIVLLSACDTHPLDCSHASTANGFLIAGAKTVLATLLPLDARDAAMFLGRLILRISMFLQRGVENMPIKWTWVISGLQRMTYITELRYSLSETCKLSLSKESYLRIGFLGNCFINAGDRYWYEKTLKVIAGETKLSIDNLKEFVKNYFQIPEVLKYIQLGNPELIFIVRDDYYNKMRELDSQSGVQVDATEISR